MQARGAERLRLSDPARLCADGWAGHERGRKREEDHEGGLAYGTRRLGSPDPAKLDNQQIWTGPGLRLLVLVISSNDPDFLRLLFAMGRDVLLAGNATTVPADESLSCLSAAAVLSAEDFSLDSGAD